LCSINKGERFYGFKTLEAFPSFKHTSLDKVAERKATVGIETTSP
jgi:hypothetical protein